MFLNYTKYNILILSLALAVILAGCKTSTQAKKTQKKTKAQPTVKATIKSPKKKITTPDQPALPSEPNISIPIEQRRVIKKRKTTHITTKKDTIVTLKAFSLKANLALRNRILSYNSFISVISILPPFIYNPQDVQQFKDIIHLSFVGNEKKLDGLTPIKNRHWKVIHTAHSLNPEKLGLFYIPVQKQINNTLYYAVANINMPNSLNKVNLYIKTNGYIKIWLNNQLLFMSNQHVNNGEYITRTVSEVSLKKGDNRFVIKTVKLHNQCSFSLRLTTRDEEPIQFNQ
jgi:hypothetical protein